jgi:superfamily II DNA or RNA helicase
MKNKTVKAGNKKKPFMQTEWAAYQYWDKQFKRAMFMDDKIKTFMIRNTSAARAKILYNLESKIKACQKLVTKLEAKKHRSILFGNSLDALKKVTPNVVDGYNSDKQNEALRKAFDNKKIDTIASFKKLKQGANLVGLDTCIIMSYYSKSKDLIQRIGRLRNDGTLGDVYIFLTLNTQEEKWFQDMFADTSSFNLIYYNNITECLKKVK